MEDTTPQQFNRNYTRIVWIGRFFILTTLCGIIATIWFWFDGRFLALSVLSLLCFIWAWWAVADIRAEYEKFIHRRGY